MDAEGKKITFEVTHEMEAQMQKVKEELIDSTQNELIKELIVAGLESMQKEQHSRKSEDSSRHGNSKNIRYKHYSVRMDQETGKKLQYIAKWEGRSMNAQIIHLMNCCIRRFEQKDAIINQSEKGEQTYARK